VGVRHTETNVIIWSGVPGSNKDDQASSSEPVIPRFTADRFYNAGDKGCAFGPLDEIAAMMQQLVSGQTIEIHATDPTVAIDLTAWCRMTGNQLVEQQGAHFLVQHK
jgi:TusA-related sulfurtransferase